MDNRLEELLTLSRKWARLKRGSEVVHAAIDFLCTRFQVDAGCVTYERPPRDDGTDYLRRTHRWFTSWGYDVPDIDLRRAFAKSMHFAEQLRFRQWFAADELPEVWAPINQASGMQLIGIWLINFDDNPVGTFVLARKSAHMDDSELISYCMAHIAVVLEMVLQRRIAEEVSIRDPLTGLLNRRGFLNQFEALTSNPSGPLTLGVLDIDCFKQTNDHHGHHVGDEVLKKVGAILATHAEAYQGVCARTGGDEFAVLARIDVEDVHGAANTMSGWFLEHDLPVSAGCAVLGQDGADYDACYQIADRRLYAQKATKETSRS